MLNPENKPKNDPERWPPCGRAQADGVPCQQLDRDCEECEQAYPELQQRTEDSIEAAKRHKETESR
jgi:hypothetical protein